MSVIGVVGLGTMGLPIARRLLAAGHEVHGCDPSAERRAALDHAVSSADELPAVCEVFLLVLPTGAITLAAAEELPLGSGDAVVNLGTIGPDAVLALEAALSGNGVRVLDAPMGKSSHDAERGTLALMVAGEQGLADELEPLLRCFASEITFCGELGMASAVKIVNNLISAAILAVVAEGVSLGERAGLSLETIVEVLSKTGADSWHLRHTFGERVAAGDFQAGFSVDLAAKDLGIGLDLAARRQVPLPLIGAALQRYVAAQAEGLGGEDWGALAKLRP
jgi:3-hydroxyisobutyrate dehydrogenase-like beta-hydroxyacid dehydrogenase